MTDLQRAILSLMAGSEKKMSGNDVVDVVWEEFQALEDAGLIEHWNCGPWKPEDWTFQVTDKGREALAE